MNSDDPVRSELRRGVGESPAFTSSHRNGVNFYCSMLHGNMELSAAVGRLDKFGRIRRSMIGGLAQA